MRFAEPKLDNRNFQDIVDELKRRIPLYCPEWTDHNVSDPGITMIELFAYVAEQLLYRMNQIPLLHYITFAQFLGIPLPLPQPARADVAFFLSVPRLQEKFSKNGGDSDHGLLIPAGTEISTTQTETIEPLIFTTETNATVMAPNLIAVSRHQRGADIEADYISPLDEKGCKPLFSEQPLVGDEFHFEFGNDLSEHIIRLRLDFIAAEGTNIKPDTPPVTWQAYSHNNRWESIQVLEDTTRGLNDAGVIKLHLPKLAPRIRETSRENSNLEKGLYFSIRVCVTSEGYRSSPILEKIHEAATLGRTVEAVHTQIVVNEFLGVSDGSPGQRFSLGESPIVLPLIAGETLKTIDLNNQEILWEYVEHFEYPDADASSSAVYGASAYSNGAIVGSSGHPATRAEKPRRYFTVDIATNEVRLGPAIQMPDGQIVSYGDIPEHGTQLHFTSYRFGGSAANVPSKALNVLKTSIPYIARVENGSPASDEQKAFDSAENFLETHGGQDIPMLDALEAEVQRFVRFRTKGLTGNRFQSGSQPAKMFNADEYESLVLERFHASVARAECVTVDREPLRLHVYVIGHIQPERWVAASLTKENLDVPKPTLAEIDEYLYQFRPITEPHTHGKSGNGRIAAKNPDYLQIDVKIDLGKSNSTQNQDKMRVAIESTVANYLHPVTGGHNGRGWPLNDVVDRVSIQSWLTQRIPDIEIQDIRLDEKRIGPQGASTRTPHIIIPGQCTVIFK